MSNRIKLHVKLVRKPTAANIAPAKIKTGEELRRMLSDRARKILNGEALEPLEYNVNVY